MEKALTFSKDQKNLIWQRFVQPAGGTQPELMQFIEICETFGLNPLLGDIVFQRYNTKNGPKTNFITTRDGLLRVATHQPDFIGAPNAGVVKEGDEFEFIPSEGDVKHKFGKKRGKIIGAYAVMYHKRFRPVSVFVDFEEYFKANAKSQQQYGGSPIWDSMPTAMITKVAEVFVLKRQFPLGGLYTAEEMGIDDIGNSVPGDAGSTQPVLSQETPPTPSQSQNEKQEKPVSVKSDEQEQKQEKSEDKTQQEKSKNEQTDQQKSPDNKQKKQPAKEQPVEKQQEPEQQPKQQESQKQEVQLADTDNGSAKGREYVLENFKSGTSPSGVPFAKLTVTDQETNEEKLVLAKGQESVDLTAQIPDEQPFNMETSEENGFHFLEAVNGQRSARTAS
ncbi:RecT family recombinase [Lentibacillus salinarum]|uniref:RecT family recombinase n=1 Tax=Lentibacillus salinarum TaxID=446820 RepID=A0ABW3ZXL7_9BACI